MENIYRKYRPYKLEEAKPLLELIPSLADEAKQVEDLTAAFIANFSKTNASFVQRRFESAHFPQKGSDEIVAVFNVMRSTANSVHGFRLVGGVDKVTKVMICIGSIIVWDEKNLPDGFIPLELLPYNEVQVVAFTTYKSRNELYDAKLTLEYDAIMQHEGRTLRDLTDERVLVPGYNFVVHRGIVDDYYGHYAC